MANIFNRNDEGVKKDTLKLSQEEFIAKYSETTATELVLTSVHKAYNKAKVREKQIAKMTDDATNFPVSTKPLVTSDKNGNPDGIMLITKIGDKRAVVETDDAGLKETIITEAGGKVKRGKRALNEDSGEVVIVKDKPGRTPRMRELLADKSFAVDKKKIKAQLEAEGFNCDGSGFHSEWHRISKPFIK